MNLSDILRVGAVYLKGAGRDAAIPPFFIMDPMPAIENPQEEKICKVGISSFMQTYDGPSSLSMETVYYVVYLCFQAVWKVLEPIKARLHRDPDTNEPPLGIKPSVFTRLRIVFVQRLKFTAACDFDVEVVKGIEITPCKLTGKRKERTEVAVETETVNHDRHDKVYNIGRFISEMTKRMIELAKCSLKCEQLNLRDFVHLFYNVEMLTQLYCSTGNIKSKRPVGYQQTDDDKKSKTLTYFLHLVQRPYIIKMCQGTWDLENLNTYMTQAKHVFASARWARTGEGYNDIIQTYRMLCPTYNVKYDAADIQ